MNRIASATFLVLLPLGCGDFEPDIEALRGKILDQCGSTFGQPDCARLAEDPERKAELDRLTFEIGASAFVEDDDTEACLLSAACEDLQGCLSSREERENPEHANCVGPCFARLRKCGGAPSEECEPPKVSQCMKRYAECIRTCGEILEE